MAPESLHRAERRHARADRRTRARPAPGARDGCRALTEDGGEAVAIAGNGRGPGALVLMGFAGAYAAIETAWSLQEAGYRVAAFERGGERSALRHVRQVEVHEVTAPERDARR